jgi:4'-phosphopantetheinyl transferase EntD
MALLAALLDPRLVGEEIKDKGQPVWLPAPEAALVEKSAPKRQREFALGRICARHALAKLGHRGAVIGRAANGAPLWPQGIVGSITHTQDYAAAAVGEARNFSGIGVDAERVGGVTEDLWLRLFDDAERASLTGLDAAEQPVIATLLFSAKEACYKAWGGVGTLAFREIRVTPQGDRFTAVRAGKILQGRYAVDGDLMVTAVWF